MKEQVNFCGRDSPVALEQNELIYLSVPVLRVQISKRPAPVDHEEGEA